MFTKAEWDKSFIFNSIRLRREWLDLYVLKSILMALCTRTPASNLVLGLPYRTIDGVRQVDKDQRHSGALCLIKSMVPGMCGNMGFPVE